MKNKKIYIGQTKDFYKRKRKHLHMLKNYNHDNYLILNDSKKYKIKNFRIDFMYMCHPEELDLYEQKFIMKQFKKGQKKCYNISYVPGLKCNFFTDKKDVIYSNLNTFAKKQLDNMEIIVTVKNNEKIIFQGKALEYEICSKFNLYTCLNIIRNSQSYENQRFKITSINNLCDLEEIKQEEFKLRKLQNEQIQYYLNEKQKILKNIGNVSDDLWEIINIENKTINNVDFVLFELKNNKIEETKIIAEPLGAHNKSKTGSLVYLYKSTIIEKTIKNQKNIDRKQKTKTVRKKQREQDKQFKHIQIEKTNERYTLKELIESPKLMEQFKTKCPPIVQQTQ